MKKLILFLFIFCFGASNAIAQDYENPVNEADLQSDTIEIISLITQGQKLRRTKPDSALYLLNLAFQKSEIIGYGKGQMRAKQNSGVTNGMRHNYAEAITNFSEGIILGAIYNYPELEADCYNGLGIVYKRIGDYVTSLKYYNESLLIYKANGLVEGISRTYGNLGVLYDLMGELEESYKYYNNAYAIDDSLNNVRSKHSLLTNIAIYHMRKKEFSRAIELLKTNVHYYDSTNIDYNLKVCYNNLSYIYKLTEQYNLSIKYATKAIELVTSANKLDAADSYLNRSESYRKKGQFRMALEDAKMNFKLSESLGFAKRLESYELLANTYDTLGQFKAAASAFKMIGQYKDSLFEHNKVQQYKAEEIKQNVRDKNQQIVSQERNIELLNERVEREKEWKMFLGIVAALFLILIMLLFQKYSYRNKTNRILKEQNKLIFDQKREIEVINEELENRMLRAQINPHFVFNALNSIQHFITVNDKKSTLKYLTKFSSLLRQILENSISAKVTMVDELKFLSIYIDLEALRFDDSFNYQLNVEEGINLHDFEVPILFLQPFVENAILHGLTPKTGNKDLTISIFQDEKNIVFEIEDNGIGRTSAAKLKNQKNIEQKSRGLSVTEQRIKMLQKNNTQEFVTYVDLKNDKEENIGTKIIIKIPKDE